MTPGLPLALTPGHPFALTPGHPLGLTPGLPLGLTPGLSFSPHPCNSLCLGREPKARVATSFLLARNLATPLALVASPKLGLRQRRLDYDEETSFSRCNSINIHLGNWRQDLQVVGWQLFKGRHSLCMMTRGEQKGEKERYLNLLVE